MQSIAKNNKPDSPAPDDPHQCWSEIGVFGDSSCPELRTYIHCHNCPVHSAAGLQLLNRALPDGYRRQRTEDFAHQRGPRDQANFSALLERRPGSTAQFESLMRAAHSIKGAARIVNLQAAVRVAHALEDCFVAVRRDQFVLSRPQIDLLLRGVDLLANLGPRSEANLNSWETEFSAEIQSFFFSLSTRFCRRDRAS